MTLIALDDPADVDAVNDNGFPVEPGEVKTTVYGDVTSVGYSEFWKAANANVQVEIKAEIHTEEYSGQRLVEIDGKRYRVLRTYKIKNGEITELTLSDLAEPPKGGGGAGAV